MKISYNWLLEYIDFNDGPEAVGEILTHVGYPLEALTKVGDDWMLDIEVTSNRRDCLGHIGLAREVAAVTGLTVKQPAIDFTVSNQQTSGITSVDNQVPDVCGRYTARVIEDVKVGPSPGWLVNRLATIGLRSVNNVVDITNYVMLEVGQPLHAFDLALLDEKRVIVRFANKGEQLTTIDHADIALEDGMLVIADAKGPVALAGVMGGADSEVSDNTTNILLEAAHFDPVTIRTTARALTLGSESSYRFERNVSQVELQWASDRAAYLLSDLAGGRVCEGVVESWPNKPSPATITLRLSRLKALVGIEIPVENVLQILDRLGLQPDIKDDVVSCIVPVWRNDITMEADLIEEVIRIFGYKNIPTESNIHVQVKRPHGFYRTRTKVINALHGSSFFETVTIGFLEDRFWSLFASGDYNPIRVKDKSRKSNNALRHTILPSLLTVRKHNQDVGNIDCHFYEIASVQKRVDSSNIPQESVMLSMVSDGTLRDLRGVIESVVASLNKQRIVSLKPTHLLWADAGEAAMIEVDGKVIGSVCQLSQAVQKAFDLIAPLCCAEIDYSALVNFEALDTGKHNALLRFPGITRDLNLLLDDTCPWGELKGCIESQSIEDLRSVDFVEIYRGKGIEKGKKSLTLSMHFRRASETLTHQQVDQYQSTVMGAIAKTFNATLRS